MQLGQSQIAALKRKIRVEKIAKPFYEKTFKIVIQRGLRDLKSDEAQGLNFSIEELFINFCLTLLLMFENDPDFSSLKTELDNISIQSEEQ